jgi:hypothetical protein
MQAICWSQQAGGNASTTHHTHTGIDTVPHGGQDIVLRAVTKPAGFCAQQFTDQAGQALALVGPMEGAFTHVYKHIIEHMPHTPHTRRAPVNWHRIIVERSVMSGCMLTSGSERRRVREATKCRSLGKRVDIAKAIGRMLWCQHRPRPPAPYRQWCTCTGMWDGLHEEE